MLATIRTGAIGFVIGLLVAAIIVAIVHFRHGQPAVVAAPAPELANLKTEDVPIKSVNAYPAVAKRKLNLPAAVQENPSEHVLDAIVTAPDSHEETVTAVLNADSGKTELLVHQEPLPWVRREKGTEFALDYGYKRDRASPIARVQATVDLLQIKTLHFGFTGALDGDGDRFIGIGFNITIP